MDKYYKFLFEKVKSKQEDLEETISLVQLAKKHSQIYNGMFKLFPYPTKEEAEEYAIKVYNKCNKKKKRKNKVNYKTYILSDKWKKKVAYIKLLRNNRCEVCGNKNNLQVHHLTYKNLGKEKDEDLQLLCAKHHMEVHGIGNSEKDIMKHIIEISKDT